MAPKIEPRRLAEKLAVEAINASFESGTVGPATVGTVPSTAFAPLPFSTRSILRPSNSDTRLSFSSDTTGEAFASLVAPSDKWGRIYYTTALGPRFTVSDNYTEGELKFNPVSYTLGVKTPQYQVTVGTPAFTVADGVAPDLVKVRYTFTFVDKYGHEGAPSVASTIVDLPFNATFSTRLTFIAETLADTNVASAVRRVYRATFDGTSSAWQFVADVPFASSFWDDTVALGEEGEELISLDWVPPPVLAQMVPVSSGFVAGYYDHYLCYSALRLPHAWPENYRYPLKYKIVGLKPTQNGLLVATTGKPYWAFGADPASAIPVELDANHPCLSGKSLVDMGGYVVYASHDGLVAVDGQSVEVLSAAFVDRFTWLRDFAPASIVAFAHEGRYVFSVGADWWVFDPADVGFSRLSYLGVTPTGLRQAYYDAARDTTVLLGTDGVAFDVVSMATESFTWKSKLFETPPASFSVARVLATAPATLRVWVDGVETAYAAPNGRPFRVKPVRGELWQLQIECSGRVTSVVLAQAMEELQ